MALARPRVIPLSTWENLEGQGSRPYNPAHTSVGPPGPSQKKKKKKPEGRRGDDFRGKVRLDDERTTYLL